MSHPYATFLAAKAVADPATGLATVPKLNEKLFDFQRDIVAWSLRRGRAAIWADCGMGKSFCELEWAKHVPGRVLIVAPLAVSVQHEREGHKFGIDVKAVKVDDGKSRILVTNYQRIDAFNPAEFTGVCLDESGILRDHTGAFRNKLIADWGKLPYRLAATATPAPNDYMELGNHSEFLGIMSRSEMLSMFFVHDGGETQQWRLKGHAEADFWRWLASWAVMIRKPSDLGYDDGNFILPPLEIKQVTVESTGATDGHLFKLNAHTLSERLTARRDSVDDRVAAAAKLANEDRQQWIMWCNLNSESEALTKAIPDAVQVTGSDSDDHKERALLAFSLGKIRVLVSKPSICGHGMNLQLCAREAFVGLSDSWEQFYQAVRRCWRFGQKHKVIAYVITADTEGAVVKNITRKETDAARMAEEMVKHMKDLNAAEIRGSGRTETKYEALDAMEAPKWGSSLREPVSVIDQLHDKRWSLYLGDSCEVIKGVASESIGFTVHSPPFSQLYVYSDSPRDMGNSKDDGEFFSHYGFLVSELFRVTKPGRLCSVHCMNLPTSKERNGYIGLRDFRGDIIRLFQSHGWIYASEVCIWKDPVTAMQRTKALGLLHKQLVKDSCMSRQGIPDYVCTFRKPGENAEPVAGQLDRFVGDPATFQPTGNLSIDIWQRYASPIWDDINPSNTLQRASAREEKDERHIAPLQLEVIERCLQLWSNPDDVVFSPFAGIGSEGYVAVKLGRRFIGMELKPSYWKQACLNLQAIAHQGDFALA